MDWNEYFFGIAEAVSKKSHCLSHHFGAIAVLNNFILATGYNGPPMNYPHCSGTICPRHILGYKSGEGLEVCPAAHAELNVLIEAARLGIKLEGSTLYLTSPTPCRECSKAIVNAGIKEIATLNPEAYPDVGLEGRNILETCGVTIRIYKQEVGKDYVTKEIEEGLDRELDVFAETLLHSPLRMPELKAIALKSIIGFLDPEKEKEE